ncbi:PREDICTED: bcl-2-related ovarian killer protein-like [Priapulus caudatus]|uniref:Bcl-2-related ovarian killer protein-like n=1 Tax=Priapulus caudatus TaxID=37621 RepID=A0ABM1EBY3_PRICU|nr:PREDICTED: bcl-2-related ovarian killer protein-like [Priapulus caudatus]
MAATNEETLSAPFDGDQHVLHATGTVHKIARRFFRVLLLPRRPAISKHNVLKQTRLLVRHFIHAKLIQEGLPVEDQFSDEIEPTEISHLLCAVQYLELTYPCLYQCIATSFELKGRSVAMIHDLFQTFCESLFATDIAWGKIVAMFAVLQSIAVDSVRQGRAEFLVSLPDILVEIIDSDIASWIAQRGGWAEFVSQFQVEAKLQKRVAVMSLVTGAAALLTVLSDLKSRSKDLKI